MLLNPIGPFEVPEGKYSLFQMPDDMFIDFNRDKLEYDAKVVWCSQLRLFKTGILKIELNTTDMFIFAYSNFTTNCNVSVTATNTYNLTSEAIVGFNVYRCASK